MSKLIQRKAKGVFLENVINNVRSDFHSKLILDITSESPEAEEVLRNALEQTFSEQPTTSTTETNAVTSDTVVQTERENVQVQDLQTGDNIATDTGQSETEEYATQDNSSNLKDYNELEFMKYSRNPQEFADLAKSHVVRVVFVKKDGTIREMWGTRHQPFYAQDGNTPSGNGEPDWVVRQLAQGKIRMYDLENRAWRQINLNTLVRSDLTKNITFFDPNKSAWLEQMTGKTDFNDFDFSEFISEGQTLTNYYDIDSAITELENPRNIPATEVSVDTPFDNEGFDNLSEQAPPVVEPSEPTNYVEDTIEQTETVSNDSDQNLTIPVFETIAPSKPTPYKDFDNETEEEEEEVQVENGTNTESVPNVIETTRTEQEVETNATPQVSNEQRMVKAKALQSMSYILERLQTGVVRVEFLTKKGDKRVMWATTSHPVLTAEDATPKKQLTEEEREAKRQKTIDTGMVSVFDLNARAWRMINLNTLLDSADFPIICFNLEYKLWALLKENLVDLADFKNKYDTTTFELINESEFGHSEFSEIHHYIVPNMISELTDEVRNQQKYAKEVRELQNFPRRALLYLHTHVVRAEFRKVDGSKRVMFATLNPDILEDNEVDISGVDFEQEEQKGMLTVYDLKERGLRKLNLNTLIYSERCPYALFLPDNKRWVYFMDNELSEKEMEDIQGLAYPHQEKFEPSDWKMDTIVDTAYANERDDSDEQVLTNETKLEENLNVFIGQEMAHQEQYKNKIRDIEYYLYKQQMLAYLQVTQETPSPIWFVKYLSPEIKLVVTDTGANLVGLTGTKRVNRNLINQGIGLENMSKEAREQAKAWSTAILEKQNQLSLTFPDKNKFLRNSARFQDYYERVGTLVNLYKLGVSKKKLQEGFIKVKDISYGTTIEQDGFKFDIWFSYGKAIVITTNPQNKRIYTRFLPSKQTSVVNETLDLQKQVYSMIQGFVENTEEFKAKFSQFTEFQKALDKRVANKQSIYYNN